jgi:hypothetical protein
LLSSSAQRKTSRDKVRAHRARKRKQGLRIVQMWVPDTTTAEFAAEARRQCRRIARSPGERDDMAFIELLLAFDDELGTAKSGS